MQGRFSLDIRNHAQIISLWPSSFAFAHDVGAARDAGRLMRHRNNIPPDYWLPTVEAAKRRGMPFITLSLLMQTRKPRKRHAF